MKKVRNRKGMKFNTIKVRRLKLDHYLVLFKSSTTKTISLHELENMHDSERTPLLVLLTSITQPSSCRMI